MYRFWSLLFFLVPVLGVATFLVAPYYNHWFPRDVSTHGRTIDSLFMFILWLTGIVFVVTDRGIGAFESIRIRFDLDDSRIVVLSGQDLITFDRAGMEQSRVTVGAFFRADGLVCEL